MTEQWKLTIRFVDRDMVMRFYWGLGVGHVYSHEDAILDGGSEDQIMESEDEEDEEDSVGVFGVPSKVPEAHNLDEDLEDYAEETGPLEGNLGMDHGDDEDWEDSEDDLEEDSGDHGDEEPVSGYADMDSTS